MKTKRYDYCLYCETNHYPFCAYTHNENITGKPDDYITCDCFTPITIKMIKEQEKWLKTPEGQHWIKTGD